MIQDSARWKRMFCVQQLLLSIFYLFLYHSASLLSDILLPSSSGSLFIISIIPSRYRHCHMFNNETCISLVNSLAPGRSGCNLISAIFNPVLPIGIFTSSHDNAFRWMSWDLPENEPTLVQVMAWCRQATSHYMSQCWPRCESPYGVTRAQWVLIR